MRTWPTQLSHCHLPNLDASLSGLSPEMGLLPQPQSLKEAPKGPGKWRGLRVGSSIGWEWGGYKEK